MARGLRGGVLGLGLALWAAGSAIRWAFCGFTAQGRLDEVPMLPRHAATPNFGDLLGSMGKVSEAMKKMPEAGRNGHFFEVLQEK